MSGTHQPTVWQISRFLPRAGCTASTLLLVQWILGGSPDPWPLWDTEMLGHKADWPHGSANGFAAAMDTLHTSRVAVVGNGPLSQAQRDEIQSADRVVRFNAMNNRCGRRYS